MATDIGLSDDELKAFIKERQDEARTEKVREAEKRKLMAELETKKIAAES